MEVYGFTKDDIILAKVPKVKVNANHLRLAEEDGYGGIVATSIDEVGIKNPIIIDTDYNLLVGHHRFKKVLDLGLQKIPAVMIKKRICNRFTEGSSDWLYIGRMNGELVMNVCRMRDVMQMFNRLGLGHKRNEQPCPNYIKFEIEVFNVKELGG